MARPPPSEGPQWEDVRRTGTGIGTAAGTGTGTEAPSCTRSWAEDRERERGRERERERQSKNISSIEGSIWRSRRRRSRSPRREASHWRGPSHSSSSACASASASYHHLAGCRNRALPSETLQISGLPEWATERHLRELFAGHQQNLHRVEVIRDRVTGHSRGFAFVAFDSVEVAKAVVESQESQDCEGGQGGREREREEGEALQLPLVNVRMEIEGHRLLARYSTGRNQKHGCQQDWLCNHCGALNFSRRSSCFRCTKPKGSGAAHVSETSRAEIVAPPSNILKVRNLEEQTEEEHLLSLFGCHGCNQVRIMRDQYSDRSRGFGFVHFFRVEDAKKCLSLLQGSTIDGIQSSGIQLSFAREQRAPNQSVKEEHNFFNANHAAAEEKTAWEPKQYVDLEDGEIGEEEDEEDEEEGEGRGPGGDVAADTASTERISPVPTQEKGREKVEAVEKADKTVEEGEYTFDANSGYYWNPNLGHYYDPNSGMFFDPKQNRWLPYHEQNTSAATEAVVTPLQSHFLPAQTEDKDAPIQIKTPSGIIRKGRYRGRKKL